MIYIKTAASHAQSKHLHVDALKMIPVFGENQNVEGIARNESAVAGIVAGTKRRFILHLIRIDLSDKLLCLSLAHGKILYINFQNFNLFNESYNYNARFYFTFKLIT